MNDAISISHEILVPEGTLEIWLLPCLKNSKFRVKKPSRMQLIAWETASATFHVVRANHSLYHLIKMIKK